MQTYEVEVRKTGPYRGTGKCPRDNCGTWLQRSLTGDLIDGVTAHLKMVHKIDNPNVVLT